ncbi:hypothetical protein D3C72_2499870 [compost metagenome]
MHLKKLVAKTNDASPCLLTSRNCLHDIFLADFIANHFFHLVTIPQHDDFMTDA